jgi:hypothetical protein
MQTLPATALGNAGRPHAAADRPTTSLHRTSGWSRSYVLAPLRALHLDQHLRSGASDAQRALSPRPHTGNAGSERIVGPYRLLMRSIETDRFNIRSPVENDQRRRPVRRSGCHQLAVSCRRQRLLSTAGS